jgi:hypothetical protein
MITVGWDTETFPIKPGCLAPRKVCTSWAVRDVLDRHVETGLVLRQPGIAWLRGALGRPDWQLTGANMPYDFGVVTAEDPTLLGPVFQAYRDKRVRCVQTRQKVIDVALGMRQWRRIGGKVTRAEYSLQALVKLYFDRHLEKEETWRLRYGLLDGVPIEDWPEDARAYAIGDAVEALQIHEAQDEAEIEIYGEPLPDSWRQQRAAWALHLMSMWGLRADEAAVDRFVAHCEEQIRKMHDDLEGTGIFKPDGSRLMSEIKRRVVADCQTRGVAVPMTDPSPKYPEGQVLHVLAESMTFVKHLGQWGPVCRAAVKRPVCARYNELVDNGRTSCSGSEGQEGTNFQNPPRKGDVRPCFIPRPGWLFCSTDADTIELRANAQNCIELLGHSRMAEVLWAQHRDGGPDLHVTLGANIAQITPANAHALHEADDVEFANIRQLSKHTNFAFAGGAGARRFVAMAWGFDIDLAPDVDRRQRRIEWGVKALRRSNEVRDIWFETWPEERPYLRYIGSLMDKERGRGTIQQLVSGRIRGDCTYTAAANSFFSGRVADAMKDILFRLAWECYTGREYQDGTTKKSVLFGSRPVMFLHDEPILEHPEKTASERAERQRVIVVETLGEWLPDVPCTSSAVLSRRWYKGGKPIKVGGKLVPVKPLTEVGADGKAKVRWVPDERMAA